MERLQYVTEGFLQVHEGSMFLLLPEALFFSLLSFSRALSPAEIGESLAVPPFLPRDLLPRLPPIDALSVLVVSLPSPPILLPPHFLYGHISLADRCTPTYTCRTQESILYKLGQYDKCFIEMSL